MTKEPTKVEEITIIKKPENSDNNLLGKKYVYKIEDEKELVKVELEKNLVLRIIEFNGKKMIDIRKYYKGYPTKKGVRFDYTIYETLKKIIED